MYKKKGIIKNHGVFFFLVVEKGLVEIETPFDAPSVAFGLDWMDDVGKMKTTKFVQD